MIEDIQAAIPLGFFLSFYDRACFFLLIRDKYYKRIQGSIAFDIGVVIADIIFIALAYFSSFQLLRKPKQSTRLYVFGGIFYCLWVIIFLKNQTKDYKTGNTTLKKLIIYSLFVKGFY